MEIKLYRNEICAILCEYLGTKGFRVSKDAEGHIAEVGLDCHDEIEFKAQICKVDRMDFVK